MSYQKTWWRVAAQEKDFWRGYNQAKKSKSNYERGLADGKRRMIRGILWCVQIAIVVTAMFVILRGGDTLVTLQ